MKKLALILALAFAGFSLSADDVGPYAKGEWTWVDHNTWDICEYASIYDLPGENTSGYDGFYYVNENVEINIRTFGEFKENERAYAGFKLVEITASDVNSVDDLEAIQTEKDTLDGSIKHTATYRYQVNADDVSGNYNLFNKDYLTDKSGVTVELQAGTMIGFLAQNETDALDEAYGALGSFGINADNQWYVSPDGKTFTWYADGSKSKGFIVSIAGAPLPGPMTSLLLAALVAGGLFMIQRNRKFAFVR